MLPDLDRLIRLQQLESAADEARRKIADHPQRAQTLDERLQVARDGLAGAKARLLDAQNKRRAEEKDVATVQARLAKYKDQLLEVKTNREYTAILHEIDTAQNEVRVGEDRILDTMMESDELMAQVKKMEADLKTVEKDVAAERQVLDREVIELHTELDRTGAARAVLAAEISGPVLATFERVARGRRGLGIAQARDGMCTICHVRLRPQVYNEIRSNEAIIQCDSCQRILFFAGESPVATQQT